MFNLIMRSADWNTKKETMPLARMLEYTSEHIVSIYKPNGQLALDLLRDIPCLFMQEGVHDESAYVGNITNIKIVGNDVSFEYTFDTHVPHLKNEFIFNNKTSFGIYSDFEFSRNHWAVKDCDIYKFLFQIVNTCRQRPSVFHINEHEHIDQNLISVMMPFDARLTPVYAAIKDAAEDAGLTCTRADDIWENSTIIQDIVSLIDRSRIVVCDYSNRNPNVFYETGIAHTLGREVIPITQNSEDIPFDLRHLRYIQYLNNNEGRAQLKAALGLRIQTIMSR